MCSNAIALYCVVWWVGGAATKTKWIPTDTQVLEKAAGELTLKRETTLSPQYVGEVYW